MLTIDDSSPRRATFLATQQSVSPFAGVTRPLAGEAAQHHLLGGTIATWLLTPRAQQVEEDGHANGRQCRGDLITGSCIAKLDFLRDYVYGTTGGSSL
jgi:hypothetical protein